jgi:hypothetical protein
MNWPALVKEWQNKYGPRYDGPSRAVPLTRAQIHLADLGAAWRHYHHNWAQPNYPRQLESLAKICYVSIEIALQHGWDMDAAMQRYHEAKMNRTEPNMRDLVYRKKEPAILANDAVPNKSNDSVYKGTN